MIYDLIGNELHSAPKRTQVKYIEGKDVSQFYAKGNGREVSDVMKALAPDTYSCINEIIALVPTNVTDTFKVSIILKKNFWTRQVWEYATVRDYISNVIFESKRLVVKKPLPFNIAQVIG